MEEIIAWAVLVAVLAFGGWHLWNPPDETKGKAGQSTGNAGGGG